MHFGVILNEVLVFHASSVVVLCRIGDGWLVDTMHENVLES